MIVFQKINKFSEITTADSREKLLWLLLCEDGRYFFTSPNGEFTKDLYKRFSDSVYRYSPAEFEFTCSFDKLRHNDSPDGISGTFSVSAKLFPGGVGFASWIMRNKISELTDDDVKKYFLDEKQKQILHAFVKRVIEGRSLDELIERKGDVLEFNSSNNLTWIWISSIRVNELSQEISDVQKSINAYNDWRAEQEENLKKAQQQLEYEVSWANIEASRKEMARQAELAEQAHRHNIEKANKEHELQLLQYQLDEKRKKERYDFETREIETNIEKLQLERDKAKADLDFVKNSIVEQNAQIKLIGIRAEIAAVERETAELHNAQTKEDLKRLKDAEGYYCGVIKESQRCNKNILDEIKKFVKNSDKNFEELRQQISEKMTLPHASLSIIDIVRKQRKNNKVTLVKDAAEQVNVQCRDIRLPVTYPRVAVGSNLKFSFESQIAGYVTIICFGTSGVKQLLAPNFIDSCPHVEACRKYSFPGEHFLKGYENLMQDGPVGTEQLLIIVSKSSWKDIFKDNFKDIFYDFTDGAFDVLTEKQLDILSEKLQSQPENSWAAGYLSYQVTEAKKQ